MTKLKEKKGVIWTGDLNVAHTELDIFRTYKMEDNPGFTIEER